MQGCDLISCSTLFQHKAGTCVFGKKHYSCCVRFTVFCSNIYQYESAIVVRNMFCRVIFKNLHLILLVYFVVSKFDFMISFSTFKGGKKGISLLMAFVYPVLNNEMAYMYKKNLYLGFFFLFVQGNIKNNCVCI